jgi:hypothetical protein
VFENTPRAKAGARASPFAANFRLSNRSDVAGLLTIVRLAIGSVLLVGWLIFLISHRSADWDFGRQWDCTSLGRGGAHCIRLPASIDPSNGGSGAEGSCASLGRAGLVCPEHPGNEDRLN